MDHHSKKNRPFDYHKECTVDGKLESTMEVGEELHSRYYKTQHETAAAVFGPHTSILFRHSLFRVIVSYVRKANLGRARSDNQRKLLLSITYAQQG